MTDVRAFKALSLLTTSSVLVVTACTIQLRGGDDSSPQPKAEQTSRSVTAEEAAGYQHCKQVWAENRRRFFGKKDRSAASGEDDSAAGWTPAPKDQSRIPQGYPSLATPEARKP
jgi:conjugative transfer region protein TrbK